MKRKVVRSQQKRADPAPATQWTTLEEYPRTDFARDEDPRGALPAKRRELLIHAEHVLAHVRHAMRVLEDPSSALAHPLSKDPPTQEQIDAALGSSERFVEAAFRSLFANEKAHRWMMFVRAVDHAARVGIRSTHPGAGDAHDPERARGAREGFARIYPAAAERIDEAKLIAAVRAWRRQDKHWKAIHAAVRCFESSPPTERSMSREWQKFPHRAPPKIVRTTP